MKQSLGELLRSCRKTMGLTLRQVEESTGISNAYMSQLENDKIKKPSANFLYKLSMLYNIPITKPLIASGIITGETPDAVCEQNVFTYQQLTPEEETKLLEYLRFLRSIK